jgi:hypothetical protein
MGRVGKERLVLLHPGAGEQRRAIERPD